MDEVGRRYREVWASATIGWRQRFWATEASRRGRWAQVQEVKHWEGRAHVGHAIDRQG